MATERTACLRSLMSSATAVAIALLGTAACSSQDAQDQGSDSKEESPSASAALTPLPSQQSCGALQAWVQENKDHLPTQYDDFVKYPAHIRRAMFVELSADNKVQLWKTQVKHYVAVHPNMTAEQQRVIGALNALNASVYDAHVNAADAQGLKDLENNAIAAFGKNEVRTLFATMGPSSSPDAAESRPASTFYCACSEASDYCGSGSNCSPLTACTPKPTGCGFLYTYGCDGFCELN